MDQHSREIYNNFVLQQKSAGMGRSFSNTIHAPAFSRADQIGIALGTSVLSGVTNNAIHDSLVEKRLQKKERKVERQLEIEKINKTLTNIQHTLKDTPKLSVQSEKQAGILDYLRPSKLIDSLVGLNTDVAARTKQVAENLAKTEDMYVKSRDTLGNTNTNLNRAYMLLKDKLTDKMIHEPHLKSVGDALSKSIGNIHTPTNLAQFADINTATPLQSSGLKSLFEAKIVAAEGIREAMLDAGPEFFASHPAAEKYINHARALFNDQSITGTKLYNIINEHGDHSRSFLNSWVSPKIEELVKNTGKTVENYHHALDEFNDAKAFHTVLQEGMHQSDFVSGGTKAINAIKSEARTAEKIVGGGLLGLGLFNVGTELAKYPAWKKQAITETALINKNLMDAAKHKALMSKLGIGAVVGAGVALGAGALYNKIHDPLNPITLPSINNPLDTINNFIDSFRTTSSIKSTPIAKLEKLEKVLEITPEISTSLPFNNIPTQNAPEHMDDGTDEIPDWMKTKTANSIEKEGLGIMDTANNVRNDINSIYQHTPRWQHAVAGAGILGAGYLGYNAVKHFGADNLLQKVLPNHHTALHNLKEQATGYMPKPTSSHKPPSRALKYGLLGAGVLGAGYVYTRLNPEQEENKEQEYNQYKAANLMPRQTYMAAQDALALARKGNLLNSAKLVGSGLLAGLAIPTIGNALSSTYNMLQQNKIQKDMVAIQQMQAASQMGMMGGGYGMSTGYTNPVALQQSTLY